MRGPCLWNWGTPRTWGGPDRGERGRQGPRLGSTPRLKHSNSFPSAPQQIKNINVPRCLGISPSCRLPAGEYSPAQPPWQRSEGCGMCEYCVAETDSYLGISQSCKQKQERQGNSSSNNNLREWWMRRVPTRGGPPRRAPGPLRARPCVERGSSPIALTLIMFSDVCSITKQKQ